MTMVDDAARPATDILAEPGSGRSGLSEREAKRRLHIDGPNTLHSR